MSAVLVLSALALALAPRSGDPGRRRLSRAADASPRTGTRLRTRVLSTVRGVGRPRTAAATGAAVGIAAAGWVPAAAAICAGLVAATAVWLAAAMVSGRARATVSDAALECVSALAAELRAGRPPPKALALVAEHAAAVLRPALLRASRAGALGADVPAQLRSIAEQPGAELFHRVAGGWALSETSGCPLAAVLVAIEADLRARRQLRRLLDGLLSGPRATAGLLAVLPTLGVAMGSSLGARPWHVLTATAPGQLALVVGIGLDVTGVLWSARLVRVAVRA